MSGLDALSPQLGSALRRHDAQPCDGIDVGATLAPADSDALAAALGELGAAGLAALPRGTGSQAGLGNPPQRADCWLSLEKLRGIDELDADEGICRAKAGTPLAELRDAAEAAGWELPLDDAGRGGSLGGALASASLAPRALSFGRPRDVVLGLDLAHADGQMTKCGGRVVKNVTGYDLAKLYTGSLGSLGVICAAWLRLRPRPEARRWLEGDVLPDAAAWMFGEEASGECTTLRALLLADADGGLQPLVELAGDAASVERDATALGARGLSESDAGRVDGVAATRFAGAADGFRFAISFLPARGAAAIARLRAQRAELLVLPGLNLACARWPSSAAPDALFDAVADAAQAGGGRWLCESAPTAAKRGRDVFAASPAEVALGRALKSRFDPENVLNPGRFAGGV